MLTVANMGEGGVKNHWKSADILYGWSQGFHYWPPNFNSKDLAFVFVLGLFVLFLSLKQGMEQEMDNNL